MASAESIVRSTLAELNAGDDVGLGLLWLSERFAELVATTRLRALRRVGTIAVPAALTTGTVTLTRDSDVVTGDSTAQAAWVLASSTLVGRFLRVRVAWYEVAAVEITTTSAATLRLKSVYAEDTATDVSYALVQRTFTLAPDARTPGTFALPRYRLELEFLPPGQIEWLAPDRLAVYGGPRFVADTGENAAGVRTVELYPYSTTSELVSYTYWAKPPVFGFEGEANSQLPSTVDGAFLKQGLLINVMRFKQARAIDAKDFEAGAHWRNDARAQETRWEREKLRALAADAGADDLTILCAPSTYGVSAWDDRDLKTARGEWLARGIYS